MLLEQEGVSLSQVRMQDDKLMIQGAVDSEGEKFWARLDG